MDSKHTSHSWIALFLAGAASSISVACSDNSRGAGQNMGSNGSHPGAASSGSGSGGSGSSNGGAGSGSGGTGADGSTPPGIQGLFLDGITSAGYVVYDAKGGLHVAGNGSNGLRYAECSSQCAQPANWAYTDVVVAALGGGGGVGAGSQDSGYGLAVDGEGRPRVMIAPWPNSNAGAAQAPTKYLECNANCTSASNWTVTELTGVSGADYTTRPADGLHFFAVAPQGGAAFAYRGTGGVVYKSCASGCASAANWQEVVVTGVGVDGLSLAFDAAGNPHLVGSGLGAGFGYATCGGNCTSNSGWAVTTLSSGGGGMLAIDPQGRPTVLSSSSGQAGYYWCDSNCAAAASSWAFVPTERLSWGAVDAQNHLRAASASAHYLACTAGCTSASPTWQDTPFPISYLDGADPHKVPGDQWRSGPMMLSLDLAGNAAITMDATRWFNGSPDDGAVYLWLVPAVADSAGGTSGSSSGATSSGSSSSGSSSGASGSGSSSGGGSSGMSDAGSSGLSNFEGAPWTGMLTETLSCGDAGTATSKPAESVTLHPTASGFAYTDKNGCTFDFTVSGSTATLSNAPVACTVRTDAGSDELQYTSATLTSTDGHHLTVDVQGSVTSGSLSCSVAESGTLTR